MLTLLRLGEVDWWSLFWINYVTSNLKFFHKFTEIERIYKIQTTIYVNEDLLSDLEEIYDTYKSQQSR